MQVIFDPAYGPSATRGEARIALVAERLENETAESTEYFLVGRSSDDLYRVLLISSSRCFLFVVWFYPTLLMSDCRVRRLLFGLLQFGLVFDLCVLFHKPVHRQHSKVEN